MWRTLSIILAIQTSTMINLFIYYAQKLPLVGRFFRNQLYASIRMKRRIAVLARIIIMFFGFVLSLGYVALLIYWPLVEFGGTSKEVQWSQFKHILFMLSFVAAGISGAVMLEPKRGKYVAVKLMRMTPVRYMQSTLSYKYATFFIYLLPTLLIFGTLLGASIVQVVLLTMTVTMWRVLCEYVHLQIFVRTQVILIKQMGIVWFVIGLSYAVAYLPFIYEQAPFIGSILLQDLVMLIIIVAGLLATIQLARYPDYRTVVDAATRRDDPLLDLGRMIAEVDKDSVRSKESDYATLELDGSKFTSKEGYAYLNALFFARHRSVVNRPVHVRLAAIGIFGIAAVIITLMFDPLAEFVIIGMGTVIPVLAITMLFLSVGEKICKAIFYNCDLSLLRYSFYRRGASQHFRIRLYKIIIYNLSIGLLLAAVLTGVYLAAGGHLWNQAILLLWLCVLSLAVFFSIHHLFLYYLFQPYATELNMKNPLFYILNMVVSALCGFSAFIQVPPFVFTLIVLALTVLYLIMALILVRKYASRTLRIK